VLPGDTTWSGEVLVTGDVTVPAGSTLTIEPGTTVRFAALSDNTAGGQDPERGELIVHGSLLAEAPPPPRILFTSAAEAPLPAIGMESGDPRKYSPLSVVFRYAIIENTWIAITLKAGYDTDCLINILHAAKMHRRRDQSGGVERSGIGHNRR